MSSRSLLSLGLPKATLASLMRNGYETLQDLNSVDAQSLSSEIGIPLPEAEALLSRCTSTTNPSLSIPMTQSAASILQQSQKVPTGCEPLNRILEGGLNRDQILEISGPPGSPRERIVKGIVAAYAEDGQDVIFLDCQNMTPASSLSESLKDEAQGLVHYTKAHTLPEFLLFMQQLPRMLTKYPNAALLVLNSMSFPFQTANTTPSQRNAYLASVKQCLARTTATHKITVVLTSQLATKMVNADGTAGNFETGARGIMMPSLGSAHLPSSKTYRIVLAPDGLRSGTLRLMSSPQSPEMGAGISVPYSLESVDMSVAIDS